MPVSQEEYLYIESTTSLCSHCLKRIDGKIIVKEGKIYVLKYCIEHGKQEEILEEDAEYYLGRMKYTKPGSVSKTQTERGQNCPFDCGLCPEHEQHSCIGLIEVTNKCDLKCPTCYANSGDGEFLPLDKIGEMLDFFVDSEFGNAEILQISGGEPTTHPQIIEIIKLARKKNIKYVMLNTNGLRLAHDRDFARELSQFVGGFEVYLQFDGFDKKTYEHLRGRDLLEIKQSAINNLTEFNIPITLVSTIERGINDQEVGRIVEFGINSKCIRGINFQPVAFFGRHKDLDAKNRITITGIINNISKEMNGMVGKKDFFPLPCNVDRVAIAYLYKLKGEFVPLTRDLQVADYLPIIRNTFKFDPEDFLKDLAGKAFSPSGGCCDYLGMMKNFSKLIPKSYFLKSEKEKVEYVSENIFRISITSFVDAYNFDMKSMKKECVHVITPDLKKIPFSAYNMLYRNK
ncbi:radical SAM protein [Candidatus Falkowbacteria bacterium]|nr:radical SAM protein [Candidatus Falkowbacteria bacterium]